MYGAESPIFYHAVGVLTCAVLFAMSIKRPIRLCGNSLFTAFEAFVGVFGVLLLLAAGEGVGKGFFVIGCALISLSSLLMGLQIQQYFALLDSGQLKSVLIASAFVEAILFVAYPLILNYLYAIAAVLFAVRAVLFGLAERGSIQLFEGASVGQPENRQAISFPASLAVSIVATVVSWSFLQTQVYMGDPIAATTIIVATKLLAVAVFTYFMLAAHDLSFAPSGKLICVALLCAMALHLGSDNVYLSTSVMDVGYSLFELVAYLVLGELSSRRPASAMKILSGFYLVVHTAYLVGGGLGIFSHAGVFVGDGRLVETGILIALVFVSVYCFDEKRVMSFLSNSEQLEREEEGARGKESFAEDVFKSFGLTDREMEVALLYAKGRSAVYIAEELQISPHTVRSHMARIYEKCLVHSRQELLSLLEERRGMREE